MNRLTKVLLGSVAAVGLFAGGALASPTIPDYIDDVDISEAHVEAVQWAGMHRIVEGHADGSFRPGTPVSRQQMASLLRRYHARSTVSFEGEPTRVPAGQIVTAVGRCGEVMIPLSGGYAITDEPDDAAQASQISILRSQPADVDFGEGWSNRGWEVRVANGSDRDVMVQVSLVCTPTG